MRGRCGGDMAEMWGGYGHGLNRSDHTYPYPYPYPYSYPYPLRWHTRVTAWPTVTKARARTLRISPSWLHTM